MSRALATATLAVLAALTPPVQAEEPPSVLEFKTTARTSKGVVRCGLFTESGWLKTPVKKHFASVRNGVALCVFKDVPKGVYGISAFHDENENGKLDTNLFGMPTEDYCASRDARGTLGPPSFADAKFSYSGGSKRLSATLK